MKKDQVDQFNGDFIHYFQLQCNLSSFDVEDFYICWRSIIYDRKDVIFDALTFNMQKFIMKNLTIDWEPLMLHWGLGMCQTIKHLGKLNVSISVKIGLDKKKKYRIWLHDPNFFYMSGNPSSFPGIQTLLLNLDKEYRTGFSKNQFILAEENILLNRDKAPCTDYKSIGSSFSRCIIDFVRNKTGCKVRSIIANVTFQKLKSFKLRWDNYTNNELFDECDNMKQIKHHSELWSAYMSKSLESMISETGCQMPCSYVKYYRSTVK